MKHTFRGLAVVAIALALTGCGTVAPQYNPSLDNVTQLKQTGDGKVAVNPFTAATANLNAISIRGGTMTSPYAGSYANYVTEALKQELTLSGKYAPDAGIVIEGALLKNDLDASGISTGIATMDVRFVVKNGTTVRFDKVKSVTHTWDSAFMGSIAIPNAIAAYPATVRKLLESLYADQDFNAALK